MIDRAKRILETAPLDNSVRADLWDAFYSVRGTSELATRLADFNIPSDVKESLVAAKRWWMTLPVIAVISLLKRCGIGLGILLVFIYGINFLFNPAYRYSTIYFVDQSNVTIEHKPRDCNYDWSPAGVKGCHYKKVVIVVGDDPKQRQVTVSWERVEEQP